MLLLWRVGVALGHHGLDRDRAFDRCDNRGKLQQHAIAHRLDEPAAERPYDRRRRLAPLADRPRRPRLVLAHEARVADDVGGEDRGEAAGGGHSGTPALRMRSSRNSFDRPDLLRRPYREARVEREAGFGFGSRLFQSSKIRQRCGEEEMG